jgi:hypothetical protein
MPAPASVEIPRREKDRGQKQKRLFVCLSGKMPPSLRAMFATAVLMCWCHGDAVLRGIGTTLLPVA